MGPRSLPPSAVASPPFVSELLFVVWSADASLSTNWPYSKAGGAGTEVGAAGEGSGEVRSGKLTRRFDERERGSWSQPEKVPESATGERPLRS